MVCVTRQGISSVIADEAHSKVVFKNTDYKYPGTADLENVGNYTF